MEEKNSLPLSEMPIYTTYSSGLVEVEDNFIVYLSITSIISRLRRLIMHLFIYNLATENLERVQMYAFVEREDGITDSGVVGQSEVFLRGARWRGWMAVPVGEDLEAVFTSIAQSGKLILRRKGEVLAGVVDVLHPVVLCHDIAIRAAGAQQVAACLVGCVLPGLAD